MHLLVIWLQSGSYNERAEVLSDIILEFLDSSGDFSNIASEILEKHGMKELKPREWYPFKEWLDAFKEISEKVGPTILYIAGTRVSEKMRWPPNIGSLQKGLESLDEVYHSYHRNDNIGNYKTLIFDSEKREAEIKSDTPYPCDFDRGIIMSAVNRYRPKDARRILVVHKDLRSCRKKGINDCIYLIKW